jgi:hypothetical protein
MAELTNRKKRRFASTLPVPLPTKPPEPGVKPHETVRIQLPVREPGIPPVTSPSQSAPENISSANLFAPPKPPAASRPLSASVRTSPIPSPSALGKGDRTHSAGARTVALLSEKNSAMIAMPNIVPQNPPIAVAPVGERLNAAVLDTARDVRIDFDYPDLDVFFPSYGKF